MINNISNYGGQDKIHRDIKGKQFFIANARC